MPEDLRERIAAQFSGRGSRADVWRVFDLLLDTDAYLNLGHSGRFQPHVLGSSQRRLATHLGRRLAAHLPATRGARLLDVGCGRGGPTVHLAERFGFDATGLDLVAHNAARARSNAAARGVDASFVVGDATRPPFPDGSMAACASADAFVYLPDRPAVFEAVADVLEPGGVLVFSDLLARAPSESVDRFADAWDMPPPGTRAEYERALDAAGLDVRVVDDVSAHSVGRFRKWTALFLWLHATPLGRGLDWALARRGIDAATVVEQVRRAHAALPALRHLVFVAEA